MAHAPTCGSPLSRGRGSLQITCSSSATIARTATTERELLFKTGDPLGLEALNESQRRLAALGLLGRARITELGHGSDTRRDILVSVEEAPVTTIGYGGGLEVRQILSEDQAQEGARANLEFAPRAFFEVSRRNLFGKNRSINLFTRVSLRPQGEARDFSDTGSSARSGSRGRLRPAPTPT